MPELGPLGSVRGALSNERPYRDLHGVYDPCRYSRIVLKIFRHPCCEVRLGQAGQESVRSRTYIFTTIILGKSKKQDHLLHVTFARHRPPKRSDPIPMSSSLGLISHPGKSHIAPRAK